MAVTICYVCQVPFKEGEIPVRTVNGEPAHKKCLRHD